MSVPDAEKVDEQRAASPSSSPREEEKNGSGDAAVGIDSEKKSAQPERTATFKDYMVSWSRNLAVLPRLFRLDNPLTDEPASILICFKMGLSCLWCGCHRLYRRRRDPSHDEHRLWFVT